MAYDIKNLDDEIGEIFSPQSNLNNQEDLSFLTHLLFVIHNKASYQDEYKEIQEYLSENNLTEQVFVKNINDKINTIHANFPQEQEQGEEENEEAHYQAPIKGSYKSSGGFSVSPTDKNHPQGHMGVDLRAPGGTSLYSIAPGKVTFVGNTSIGGNVINISHPALNSRSYYAHLSSVNVRVGQEVDYDDIIGTVGNTGNAKGTAPHLHLQVWINNQITDPAKLFTVPPYTPMSKDEKMWIPANPNAQANKKIQQIFKKAEFFYNLTCKF